MILKKLINNKALSKRLYSTPSNKGLLEGVRVLDLTRILAGPYCTMLLGDMGADIIKIERPTVGDDTRSWGPPFATPKNPSQAPESAYFLCVNRNKRSVTVDLKSPKGLQIIKDLVKVSDVLVENYIPGKLEEMGLGYETLKELNPKLVYASITGYGPDGPFAKTPGYDVMIEAEAGLMHITGHPEAPPAKVGVAITDVCTGLYAHGAILASLLARERTGLGQKVDLSLLKTQLACLVNLASSHLIGGSNPMRSGTSHPSIVPYQSFETKDGHIVVGAGNDKQFQKLTVKLNIESLKESNKFNSNPNRVKNRKELIHLLNERFKENTTEYWLKQLKGGGFPFAPINDVEKTFKHPQAEHRKMIETVKHSTCGDIKLVGLPVKYSEVGTSIRLPPPTLGQHTQEVLKTVLNYNKHQIEELVKSKVV